MLGTSMVSSLIFSIPTSLVKIYSHMIVLDVETTNRNPELDRITELAALCIGSDGVDFSMDAYVQLPDDVKIEPEVEKITGLTREFLSMKGLPESEVARRFALMLRIPGPILFVSHNAQFDLSFLRNMFNRYGYSFPQKCGVIDTLTVFKDRFPYPHKLSDAILYYNIDDVENTHQAMDDVMALCAVFYEMNLEKDDLADYVNVFGYHPKYGYIGEKIPGIVYYPQEFNSSIRLPDIIKERNL